MKLQVLNPVAQTRNSETKKGALAPRLPKLEGKLIGLYWNLRTGGDAALKRVDELLKARYAGLETKFFMSSVKSAPILDGNRSGSNDDLKRIAQECAAVIGSTAD